MTIPQTQSDTITEGAGADVLRPEDVREFAALLRSETGVDLSEHDAWNRAIELIALVRMLLSPLPEDPHLSHAQGSDVASLDGPGPKTLA